MANTNGSGFMRSRSRAEMIPGPDSPMNRSVPSRTSAGEPERLPALVFSASHVLGAFIDPAS